MNKNDRHYKMEYTEPSRFETIISHSNSEPPIFQKKDTVNDTTLLYGDSEEFPSDSDFVLIKTPRPLRYSTSYSISSTEEKRTAI